ncbi:hypothetical protein OAF54_00985 [bacterium]|nr:hypothetical protein [bacterium]
MSKGRPNKKEIEFHRFLMEKGCCVCGRQAVFHHVNRPYPHKRRDHRYGTPLCHLHHSKYHDKFGNVDAFQEAYGVNLEEIAQYYMDQYWG